MNVTSKDPSNTRLAFTVLGSNKWGYRVQIEDPDEPGAYIDLFPNTRPPSDWATAKQASLKAAEVLRELADLIEAATKET